MAHILVLAPQLPYPPHQGTTIRNYNLLIRLARRHTLDLLTFLPAPSGARTTRSGRAGMAGSRTGDPLRAACRRIVGEVAPVRSLARRAWDTLLHPLPDMALRLESRAMHDRLNGLLQASRYDVIQVEGIEMAPYALSLPSRQRPFLVFDDHNAEYVLQQRACLTDARRPGRWHAAAYSFVQWRKLVGYERDICRAADRVVAVSQADSTALKGLLPDLEITVVPNGVDLDFYRPDAAQPQPGMVPQALVFTGKMDYRPNIDAVLWFAQEVLPLILRQMPGVRFYIVGQQPHARLATLAQHPAITLTGLVPDVRPYIAGAGVYVVPLRIGGGTRLKVLEAMAMGAAIVSTRLGCDGFAFEDGREVRFADRPEEFANAVMALLRDREQAKALGQSARACVVARHGWDVLVPLMEQLYP